MTENTEMYDSRGQAPWNRRAFEMAEREVAISDAQIQAEAEQEEARHRQGLRTERDTALAERDAARQKVRQLYEEIAELRVERDAKRADPSQPARASLVGRDVILLTVSTDPTRDYNERHACRILAVDASGILITVYHWTGGELLEWDGGHDEDGERTGSRVPRERREGEHCFFPWQRIDSLRLTPWTEAMS